MSVRTRNVDFEPTGVARSKTVPAKATPEKMSVSEGSLPKGDIALKVHALPYATTAGVGACRNDYAWPPLLNITTTRPGDTAYQ